MHLNPTLISHFKSLQVRMHFWVFRSLTFLCTIILDNRTVLHLWNAHNFIKFSYVGRWFSQTLELTFVLLILFHHLSFSNAVLTAHVCVPMFECVSWIFLTIFVSLYFSLRSVCQFLWFFLNFSDLLNCVK